MQTRTLRLRIGFVKVGLVTSGGDHLEADTLIACHNSDIENFDQADAQFTGRFDGDVCSYPFGLSQELRTIVSGIPGQAVVFVIIQLFPDATSSPTSAGHSRSVQGAPNIFPRDEQEQNSQR